MLQKTEEFIASFDEIEQSHVINKSNTVVFDETVIKDDGTLPIVIGERKESGGGTVNVIQTIAYPLGCYIPFSMPDGSTPFRVFIFRTGPNVRGKAFVPAFEPKEEKGLRGHPVRLFLQSEKGYLTIELFRYIMEEFTKWWTTTRPGLHCFLICDNLSAHKDHDIVQKAKSNGIHFINIMPGSSHWFQVHDQEPFGLLKKNMKDEKNKNPTPISAEPELRKTITLARFYKAEKDAFKPSSVQAAFKDVGLFPWNPKKIIEMCEQHSSVPSQLLSCDATRATVEAIKECEREKITALREMMSDLKPVEVKNNITAKKRNCPDHACSQTSVKKKKGKSSPDSQNENGSTTEPPLKRNRGRPRKKQ